MPSKGPLFSTHRSCLFNWVKRACNIVAHVTAKLFINIDQSSCFNKHSLPIVLINSVLSSWLYNIDVYKKKGPLFKGICGPNHMGRRLTSFIRNYICINCESDFVWLNKLWILWLFFNWIHVLKISFFHA